MTETTQVVAAFLFAIAILHTFLASGFQKLSHRYPRHDGLFHILGEVEAVFGMWSIILFGYLIYAEGFGKAVDYADSRNYTEPLFVFTIMVIAASKPVMFAAKQVVEFLSGHLPMDKATSRYLVIMTVVPLLGSLITEPAAMTLAALMLLKFFQKETSTFFKYATIGTLFVNVSIGGALTHFAAPPILMVASTWNWDTAYVFTHLGWKAAIAVVINGTVLTMLVRKTLIEASHHEASMSAQDHADAHAASSVPLSIVLLHLLLVAGVVLFAHHAPVFLGIFLVFLGIATAYPQFQERLIIKEGLMVGFFLAGLVVLGGMQAWWLQPLLTRMSPDAVYFGATALTAVTDNAALTYLGSLVEGLSEEFKYALVAGALTGGGLTIIANAPNPAGASILKGRFDGGTVNPALLFAAAAGPTLVTILCFKLLPLTL
ncbi:MAG: putative Na+/H+ antiporter [Burkholderiaceae bacterium]